MNQRGRDAFQLDLAQLMFRVGVAVEGTFLQVIRQLIPHLDNDELEQLLEQAKIHLGKHTLEYRTIKGEHTKRTKKKR